MTPEIRTVREDELAAYIEAMSTGFLERPDAAKVAEEVKGIWDLRRVWAAFDGDRMCGTFRSWATEMTVPGCGRLPGAAVSSVTVLPTHRRRGVLRAMVAAEHAAMRERGEVVGLLYASEYPIYGRFGYGPAHRTATWTLDATATGFRGGSPSGIELAVPTAAIRDELKVVFDAWRARQPGEIRRRDVTWDYSLGLLESAWDGRWKGFLAIHRASDGTADGYARYKSQEKWEQRLPRYTLKVEELHALNDDAYLALWRYLAEVDWVAKVQAEWRPERELLPWLLTNARAAVPTDIGDGMWVRLLDVPRALEARTYEQSAKLVLEVADREASGGRSRLALDAGPDGARCRRTTRSADLTVDVAALGAAYMGGVRLREAAREFGAEEHRPGALVEADTLFRTADEPWCSTFF